MSYSQNGSSNYMNGSYARDTSNGYSGDRQDENTRATSRARRAGGYGGFLSDSISSPSDNYEPPPMRQRGINGFANGTYGRHSPERDGTGSNGRRRSRERDGPSLTDARMYGNGPGARQIEG